MGRRAARRRFLTTSGLAGAGYWVAARPTWADDKEEQKKSDASPNNKLNIAVIGCGGQGGSDLGNVASQNIVALCDVDEHRAKGAFERFPKAARYHDFRKLFDELSNKIDAVVVSTPDHMHAPASMAAIKLGKHVYCQKPLTHSVFEARALREAAAKHKVVTQMGNQGTSHDGFRTAVEVVRAGAIGPVREAHVWTNRPIWPQGMDRPKATPPVPNHLDWYLWLGVAPDRPYNPSYAPFSWRGWCDYGTGALGDMACHTANMAFMSLKLASPTSVEAVSPGCNGESYPSWSTITYQFPARGDLPPVKFVWYDGVKEGKRNRPTEELIPALKGQKLPDSGSLLVGDKGVLFSPNDYGAAYKLLPEENFKDAKRPEPTIARVHSQHHREWIEACRSGAGPMSNFDYAAQLTETVLLGNVAVRVGKKIEWDAVNLRVTNTSDADQFIRREYRKGWTL